MHSGAITSASSGSGHAHGPALRTPKGRLLSPSDVADRLGVSERTLESWRRGEVRSTSGPPFLSLTGGTIRYAEEDLEEWLRSRRAVT